MLKTVRRRSWQPRRGADTGNFIIVHGTTTKRATEHSKQACQTKLRILTMNILNFFTDQVKHAVTIILCL